MANIELLQKKMSESGMTTKAISQKAGMLRETLYNRMKGVGEFTASEIVALSSVLRLTKKERDDIFLDEGLNVRQPTEED